MAAAESEEAEMGLENWGWGEHGSHMEARAQWQITGGAPGQPGLHRETLSHTDNRQTKPCQLCLPISQTLPLSFQTFGVGFLETRTTASLSGTLTGCL